MIRARRREQDGFRMRPKRLCGAREQHMADRLGAGKWVISDRFADSTRIYHGTLGNVDARLIARLEHLTIGDTRPDLTVILDVPVDIGLQRASWRRGENTSDRFEAEAREFHQKLREAYIELAERNPERCALIDGCADPATVGNAIWAVVNERLRPAEAPLHFEDAAP